MNIVITGAGKGIGFELCKILLTDHNNKIFAISRDIRKLVELSKNNQNITPYSFDLESKDYKPLLNNLPFRIHILINNAGYLVNKPFQNITDDEIDRSFHVNFTSAFKLIQVFLPHFNLNSHIVNISSMGGFQGSVKFSGLSIYSASKSALACLSECLAVELKDRKININCLCLGAVQTEMLAEAFPGYSAPHSAAEMATFISDFALKAHLYINGKIIPVSISTP